MTHNRILNLLLSNILIWGLLPFQTVSAKADDASIAAARAVLIQLAELSKQQALQTEAAQKLLTGELLELKISSFGQLTDAPDKVLLLEKDSAVGRFQRFGVNNQVTDIYFYLQNDGHWKVNAVRLLALTGIIEGAYLGLKAKPSLTEAEKSLLENFRLTLAPDKELKTWFSGNSKALENLCRLLLAKSNGAEIYVNNDDKNFPAAAESLRRLNLSTATVAANGDVEIVIGGVTDNTVGFLYSPSKKPPRISPSGYIWVEEVAANWYLFRTT